MELGVDKHSCKASVKQQILLIGLGNRLVLFEHQSFGKHNDGEGRTLQINIHKLAFNSISGEVFVADNDRKSIYLVNRETGNTKRIVWDRIGNVSALSFGKLVDTRYIIINILFYYQHSSWKQTTSPTISTGQTLNVVQLKYSP